MTLLAAKRTPLSATQAISALAAGFERVQGKKPTFRQLALISGQSAFETGDWTSFSNYNFAGIKRGSAPYYQELPTKESINGVLTQLYPPDPRTQFAAYLSAEDGATAYVQLLKKRSHWWEGLLTGDVDKYVAKLKESPAYFSGNAQAYIVGVKRYIDKYTSVISQYSVPDGGGITDILLAGLVTGGVIYGSKKIKEKLKSRN